MSLEVLQQQKAVAEQRYRAGSFPQGTYASREAAYNVFMAAQNAKIAEAQRRGAALPPEPGSKAYSRQDGFVYQGQIVSQKTEQVTARDVNKPLEKKIIGTRTTTVFAPPISNEPAKPSNVELALAQREVALRAERQPSAGSSNLLGGKLAVAEENKLTTVSKAQVTSGLSSEERQAYSKEIERQNVEKYKTFGLMFGSFLAAPIVGPMGVLIGAGSSVAVSEGASLLLTGKPLSVPELAQAGAEGVIFAGLGVGILEGVSRFGSTGAKIAGYTRVAGKKIPVIPASTRQMISVELSRSAIFGGVGVVASGVSSGGKVEEMAVSGLSGAAFSLAFSAIGRGYYRLSGKVPVEITRTAGAKEKTFKSEAFVGESESITSTSNIDLLYSVEKTKVSKDYLKWYEGFKSEFKPTEIEFVGTEYSSQLQRVHPDSFVPGSEIVKGIKTGAEVRYPAESFIAASEGKPSSSVQRFVTKEGVEGVRYITSGEPDKIVVLTSQRGNLLSGSERAIYSEIGVIGQKGKVVREFSAARIWGKIDPKVYSRYLETNPMAEASVARENILNKGAVKDITTLQKAGAKEKELFKFIDETITKEAIADVGENPDLFKDFTKGPIEGPYNPETGKSDWIVPSLDISKVPLLKRVSSYLPNKFYEMGAKISQERSPFTADAINKRIDANFRASQNAIKNTKQNYYTKKSGSMKPIEGTYNRVTGKYEGYSKGSKTSQLVDEGGLPYKQMGGISKAQLETINVPEIPVYTDIVSIKPLGVSAPKSPIVIIRNANIQNVQRKNVEAVSVSYKSIVDSQSKAAVAPVNVLDVGSSVSFREVVSFQPIETTDQVSEQTIEQTYTQEQQVFNIPTVPVPTRQLPMSVPWGAGGAGESQRGIVKVGGKFFKLKHPIPLPKQLYGQVMGKRRNNVLSQVGRKGKRKKRRKKR